MNIFLGILSGTAAYVIAVMFSMRYFFGPRLKAARAQFEVVEDE
jgi:hypothetical protein